jgi:hypothetical protein
MGAAEPTAPYSAGPEQIVAIARSGARPAGWFVWPLRRNRVRTLALRAAFYGLVGVVAFVPLFLVTVPSNFQNGTPRAVATLVLLGIPAVLMFYGAWAVIGYLLQLAQADQYLLVITPTDFVKATPRRVTHVPMSCVGDITLKGEVVPGARPVSVADAFARRPPPESRGRGPTSLAFRDRCSNRTVVVGIDDSFDDLRALAEVLRLYAPVDPTG